MRGRSTLFFMVITSSKKNVMQTSYHITVTGPGEVVCGIPGW